MKFHKTIEDRMTSPRFMTQCVIIIIVYFSIKSSFFFNTIFENIVTVRPFLFVASSLTGMIAGVIVTITSYHYNKQKQQIPPLVFCVANIFLTAFILKVFHCEKPGEVFQCEPKIWYAERFFLSIFLPAIEYSCVKTWKNLLEKSRTTKKQTIASLEQDISDLKQTRSKEEQEVSELKQKKADLIEDEKKRTCKKCSAIFGSINAMNAHKCKPKETN